MENTKITHEAYGDKQTIEFSDESDIFTYLNQIERLLIAASFCPETVKEGFLAKAEQIREEEHEKRLEADEKYIHSK